MGNKFSKRNSVGVSKRPKKASKSAKSLRSDKEWAFLNADDVLTDYVLGKQLGQPGAFGTTYLCTHRKTKKVAACKRILKRKYEKDPKISVDLKTVREETAMVKKFDHPHIIKCFGEYENEQSVDMVFECCSGGELFDRIKEKQHYSEKTAAQFMKGILSAIEHIHEKRVVHADLKPDNLLFTDNSDNEVIKIIDFGLAVHVPEKKLLKRFRGTPYYVAPEVIKGAYDMDADIWSFGVIMFMTLLGFPPFHGSDDKEIYSWIQQGFDPVVKPGYGPFFPEAMPLSDEAREVISSCLTTNVLNRPTAAELLKHVWFEEASDIPLSASVLNNINLFQSKEKFKQEVLLMMTDLVSDSELAKLAKTFKSIDKNGDGKITFAELKIVFGNQKMEITEKTGLGAVLGSNPDKKLPPLHKREMSEVESDEVKNKKLLKVIEKIIAVADTDGDGALSYEELMMQVVANKLTAKERRLWAAFDRFDGDHDGVLTTEEIGKIVNCAKEEVKQMVAEVDENQDGHIDYEEFVNMWMEKEKQNLEGMLAEEGLTVVKE